MNGLTVGSVGQRLFDQSAQTAKVALEAAQLQPGLLMFKAWNGITEAYPLTEGRE